MLPRIPRLSFLHFLVPLLGSALLGGCASKASYMPSEADAAAPGELTTPVHIGMSRAEVNAALGKTKPVFNTPSGRINFEAVETAEGRVLILPYVYKNRTTPSPEDVIEHPPSYMTVLGE